MIKKRISKIKTRRRSKNIAPHSYKQKHRIHLMSAQSETNTIFTTGEALHCHMSLSSFFPYSFSLNKNNELPLPHTREPVLTNQLSFKVHKS